MSSNGEKKSTASRKEEGFYRFGFRLSMSDVLPSDPQEMSAPCGDDVFRRLEARDGHD